MRKRYPSGSGKPGRQSGFTLIELLTVIVIIAILAGLTLFAASAVMKSAARSRTRTEIAAISAALESYKTDNGAYPVFTGFRSTAGYTAPPTTVGGAYQQSSEFLYESLTGQTTTAAFVTGVKSYIALKKTQMGNYAGGNVYIQDPFGYSYGYNTGSAANPPYNGWGFFDLWSTGGDITAANIPSWISNWSN
jgi:prepilin-type N-terminal cleavage/methylation domain-containing protein